MVGTLYLGEIVRHTMITLAAEKAVFVESNINVLKTKGVLSTQQAMEVIE